MSWRDEPVTEKQRRLIAEMQEFSEKPTSGNWTVFVTNAEGTNIAVNHVRQTSS